MFIHFSFRVLLSCLAVAALATISSASAGDPVKGVKVSSVGNSLLAPSLFPPPVEQPDGTWYLDSFFNFNYEMEFNSNNESAILTGPGTGHLFGVAPASTEGALLFDAEMLSLDLAGPRLFAVREVPPLPSLGQTLIVFEADGTFRINSFFPIFTETSLDGRQTWTPNDPALWNFHSVPEPSTLLVCILVAGVLGLRRSVRRNRRGARRWSNATLCFALIVSAFVIATSSSAVAGTLYVAEIGADKVDSFTSAGIGKVVASGLFAPKCLAVDKNGNVFVSEIGTQRRISKITPAGVRTTFTSNVGDPFGLAFDANGILLVGDTGPGTVFRFNPAGSRTTLAGGFSAPWGLAFDKTGNLFMSDWVGGKIYRISQGGTVSLFAGGLGGPRGIAFDANGFLYVSELDFNRVVRFSPAGGRSIFATGISGPKGLVIDEKGNVFVAAISSGIIHKITPNGTVTVFANGLSSPDGLAYVVPEPATLALACWGISMVGALIWRHRLRGARHTSVREIVIDAWAARRSTAIAVTTMAIAALNGSPASAIPADYNANTFVDAADYTVWQDSLGAIVAPSSGADGSNDGFINSADYSVWHANFFTSPLSPNFTGGPSLAILDIGLDINGNRRWSVRVDPQDTLFSNPADSPDRGIGGSVATEIAFEVTVGTLLSVSTNPINFPFDNPGNSPFGFSNSPALGVSSQGNQIFAALGSDFFGAVNFGSINGSPKEMLVITTLGSAKTVITWSGVYGANGDQGRLAQGGVNYNTAGMVMTVPEPSSLAILACGGVSLVGLALRRRRCAIHLVPQANRLKPHVRLVSHLANTFRGEDFMSSQCAKITYIALPVFVAMLILSVGTPSLFASPISLFSQSPMLDTQMVDDIGIKHGFHGHDELSTAWSRLNTDRSGRPLFEGYFGPLMADDFAVRSSSPIVQLRWWGSYLNGPLQGVDKFLISFSADVPATTGANGFSHPGQILLNQIVSRGSLAPGSGTFSEQQAYPLSVDGPIYEYNAELNLGKEFHQQPNTVYWLTIAALVDTISTNPSTDPNVIRWGWHNRDYTVQDNLAPTAPTITPGERIEGTLGSPTNVDIWHFQDDAVGGALAVRPSFSTNQGFQIRAVEQTNFSRAQYQALVDGPFNIGRFSKDLAFNLYTVPEPSSTALIYIAMASIGALAGRRRIINSARN